jgi:hypothetical protein
VAVVVVAPASGPVGSASVPRVARRFPMSAEFRVSTSSVQIAVLR